MMVRISFGGVSSLLVIVLVCLNTDLIQGQTFITLPEDAVVEVPQDHQLTCEIDTADFFFDWHILLDLASDDWDRIWNSYRPNEIDPDKYAIIGQHNLLVKNTTAKDGGTYRCQHRTTGERHMADLLLIEDAPEFSSDNVEVVEGDTVTLTCEASFASSPVSQLEKGLIPWLGISLGDAVLDQVEATNDGSIFLEHSVIADKLHNEQNFTCQFFTQDPAFSKNSSLALQVQFIPFDLNITINDTIYSGDLLEVVEGDQFMASASGLPEPDFSWRKVEGGGALVVDGPVLTVTADMEGINRYECMATNSHGDVTEEVNFRLGGEEPGISDIPAPYQLITLAAYFNSSEKDDVISEDCQSRYQGELSKNARTLAEDVNSKIGTDLCADMAGAGMNISFTESVFYAYKNHGHTRPAFYVSSPITNTIEELDNCGAEISTHIRKYENWVEPILPPLAGCPTLGLQLGGFSENQREWKAPSN